MGGDPRSRLPWALSAGAVVVLAVVGLVWFFGGSEPEAVDLHRLAGDDTDAEPGGADLDGRWVVDPDAEPFDLEAGTGSFVGYRVDEELSGIGAQTAVGRTPAVEGEVTVADGAVTVAEVVADLTQLASDDGRRDGRVRSTLSPEASARFSLTEPIGGLLLDEVGSVSVLDATGELTIEGVTRPVEAELQAVRRDGHVVVGGSVPIVLSDFGVQAPSAPIVLSVSDEAVVEWQLHLSPS